MKQLLSCCLLLATLAGHTQQAIITNVSGPNQAGELNFPIVHLSNKTAARKINEYLQTNLLKQTTLKAPGKQVFEKVKWTDNKSGLESISYSIPANNGKWLSVGFNIESDGLHPDYYQQSFVFNVQNGDVILMEDIISPPGMKALALDVQRKRAALIDAHLKTLTLNPDGDINPKSLKLDFTACNEDAELESFYISSSKIIFHKSACLPHVISSFDANLDVSYSFDRLRPWLSAFGQRLFNAGVTDISNDRFPSLAKPLHGKIDDKYEVVMQLHIYDDNSVGGFYYYNNYQSTIELSGTLSNNRLELKELDKDDNDTAVFKLTVSGTTLSGTWTNLKTGKALPFTAGY